jgi:cytochrome c553
MTAVPSWLARALKHPWRMLGLIAGVLLAGGFAVAASGVVPLKASGGHWRITNWLLHFTMERSVATHSIPIDVPRLDHPALIKRGATHYDLGCSPCHGNVDATTPRIPQAMLPPPPPLPGRVSRWQPEELFYIIKHGVKFTGMPAWPAQQRDDEVWAVVAFLQRLPALGSEEYRHLAGGRSNTLSQLTDGREESEPRVVRDNCARCHGLDGRDSGEGAFPRLAGQRAEYMDLALRAYADGRRHSGVMGPIAASLDAESRTAAVLHYASFGFTAPPHAAVRESSKRGEQIATNGIDATLVPACVECHGPAASPKNPAYPKLAGQHADYLAAQLRLMKRRHRGGSEYVELMHAFVDRLTDQQINDVTTYFASQSATFTIPTTRPNAR